MSKLIDERIVEMSFDNSKFEKGVRNSMDSIGKLKASLDFSAVEVAAVTAISNITNKLTDLGLNLTKSLSVDNVLAGWDKYESKTKSVGTLLAQGEYTLEQINEQLDYLSWYSDETSYSFTEMFNNMTKFTAAGIGLEDATSAMIGIANWAAAAGQNSTTASAAMYQLSQAMANGYVRYQDWREAAVNKNMATTEIEEIIADTAAEMDMLQKLRNESDEVVYQVADGAQYTLSQLFTSSALTDDLWLSTDVFLAAMKKIEGGTDEVYNTWLDGELKTSEILEGIKNGTLEIQDELENTLTAADVKFMQAASEARSFTDAINAIKDAAQTVWSTIFEDIFGDYENSVKLWTALANKLYGSFIDPLWDAEAVLSEWHELGGMSALFQMGDEENAAGALWNIYDAVSSIIGTIKDSFSAVFGTNAETLYNLTVKFQEFTKTLIISEGTAEKLRNIFTSVFTLCKNVLKFINNIRKTLDPLIKTTLNIFKSLLEHINNLFDLVRESLGDLQLMENLTASLTIIMNAINDLLVDISKNEFIKSGLKYINLALTTICNTIATVISYVSNLFNLFNQNGENITNGLSKGIETGSKKVKDSIVGLASNVLSWFNKKLKIASPSKEMKESGKNIVQGIIEGIKNKAASLKSQIVGVATQIKTEITTIFKEAKNEIVASYEETINWLNSNWFFSPLITMAKNLFEISKTVALSIKNAFASNDDDNYIEKENLVLKANLERRKQLFEEANKEEIETVNKENLVLKANLERRKQLFEEANKEEIGSSENVDSIENEIETVNKENLVLKANLERRKQLFEEANKEEIENSKNNIWLVKLASNINKLSDALHRDGDTLGDNLLNLCSTILSKFSEVLLDLKNNKFIKTLKSFYGNIFGVINSFLTNLNVLLSSGLGLIQAITQTIPTTISQNIGIFKLFSQSIKDVNEETEEDTEETEETITTAFENIGEVINSAINFIIETKKVLFNSLVNIIKTLGNTITTLTVTLVKVIEKLANLIVSVLNTITDALKEFASDDKNSPLNVLMNNIANLAVVIIKVINLVIPIINMFITKLTNLINNSAVGENSPIYKFISSVFNLLEAIAKVLVALLPVIAKIIDKITAALNKFNNAENIIDSEAAQTIIAVFETIIIIVKAIFSALKSLAETVKSSLVKVEEEGEEEADNMSKMVDILVKIILAVAALLLVRELIVRLTPLSSIKNLFKSITWVCDAVEAGLKSAQFASLATAISAALSALVKLVGVLTVLAAMKKETFRTGLIRLIELMAIITVYMSILVGGLVALTIISGKLAVAADNTSDILKYTNASLMSVSTSVLIMVTSIMILIAAFTKLAWTVSTFESNLKQIKQIFGGILIYVEVLSVVLMAFVVVLAELTVKLKITESAINICGEVMRRFSLAIITMSFSVLIIVAAFSLLARTIAVCPIGSIIGASAFIVVLLSTFVGLAMLISISGRKLEDTDLKRINSVTESLQRISQSILSLSSSMLLMAVSVLLIAKGLKHIGTDNMWKAAGMIAAMMTVMLVLTTAVLIIGNKFTKDTDKDKLNAIANSIVTVSKMMTAISVAVMLLAVSIATIAIVQKIVGAGPIRSAFAVIGVMLLVTTALSILLIKMVKDIDIKDLTSAVSTLYAIGVVMLLVSVAIAGLAFALKYIKGDGNVISAILIVVGIMTALTLLFKSIANMMSFAQTDTALLNKVKNLIISLTVIIVVLSALVAGLALLTKIAGVASILSGGLVITAIMTAMIFLVQGISKTLESFKGKKTKSLTNFLATMSIVLLFVTVLAGLVAGLAIVTKIAGTKSILAAAAVMTAMVIVMQLLTHFMLTLNNLDMGEGNIWSKILVLIAISGLLTVLSLSLIGISKIPANNVWKCYGVLWAMIGVLGALMGIAALLGRVELAPDKDIFISNMIALGFMAAALGVLVLALVLLSKIKVSSSNLLVITTVVGAMVVVLYALTGIIALLGNIDCDNAIVGAKTIAILAASIATLAVGLYVLGLIDPDRLANSVKILGIIAIGIVALIGIVTALSLLVGKIPAIASGLSVLGTAAMKIITPIALLTVAIAGLVAAIAFLKSVKLSEKQVTDDTTDSIEEETDAVKNNTKRTRARTTLIEEATEAEEEQNNQNGINNSTSNTIYNTVGGFITGMANAITDNKGPIESAGFTLIAIMFDLLHEFTSNIISYLSSDAIPSIVGAAYDSLMSSFKEIINRTPEFIEMIKTFLDQIFNFLLGDYGNGETMIKHYVRLLFSTIWQIVIGVLQSIRENIKTIVVELGLILVNIIDGLIETLPTIIAKAIELIINFLYVLGNKFNAASGELGDAVTNFILNVIAGLIKCIGRVLPKIVQVFTGIINDLLRKIFTTILGEDIGNWIVDRLDSANDRVAATLTEWSDNISDTITDKLLENSPSKVTYQDGEFVAEGLANGMEDGTQLLTDTTENMIGNGIITPAKRTLEINSPSKVTEKLGQYITQGLANGIADVTPIANAIQQVNNAINSDVVTDGITIRPVVDLTDVENGALAARTMFGGINGSVNLARNTSREINNTKRAASTAASSEDIASLGETLSGNQNGDTMNNVFNITGSNAKEIADEVNTILQKQLRKGRAAYGN